MNKSPRRTGKEVAAIVQRAYEENKTLEQTADRLEELRDAMYFLASVYAEMPLGVDEMLTSQTPEEAYHAEQAERFVSEMGDALDEALRTQFGRSK